MGPLLPDDGPRGARVVRRTRGILVELLALTLVTALFPLLLVVAAMVDLALWLKRRKPWMAVRLLAMLWWFLAGELCGMVQMATIGIASGWRDTPARRARIYRLRQRWMTGHIGGLRRIFGLTFAYEGLDAAAAGPVLVLMRHASIVDNGLPDYVLGRQKGLGLRFVLKRELQMIPLIDIGGRWVPTNFVRRGSGDTAAELENLRKLGLQLGDDEGILIYPEGTRHTVAKLARAQEIIAERQPDVSPLANRLRHVLPPRLGGTLALLESARGTDVVVFGHVGLDGFEYISDIWSGGLVGGTVRMRFWRHSASDVPVDRDALIAWVYARWFELDDWIGEQRTAGGATAALPPKATT